MKRIPKSRLEPIPMEKEAEELPKFKWTGPPIGTRHQLGGDPDFLRDDPWPECPRCREKMTFYGQLDSINDDFCLGDCGVIYVFACFNCLEVKATLQSY